MNTPRNDVNRLCAVIGADRVRLSCDAGDDRSTLRDFVYSFAFNPEYAEQVRRGLCLSNAEWEAQLADGVLTIRHR
jgi:hypothetical protein